VKPTTHLPSGDIFVSKTPWALQGRSYGGTSLQRALELGSTNARDIVLRRSNPLGPVDKPLLAAARSGRHGPLDTHVATCGALIG
jgi:hypothetical protein